MQKYLADILSVLALTMSAEGERVCIVVLRVKFNIFSLVIHSFDYAWATSFVLHLPCGMHNIGVASLPDTWWSIFFPEISVHK